MIMKRIKLNLTLCIFVTYLLAISCNEKNPQQIENLALINTKWRLTNIVDITNGVTRTPNPNSSDCYLLYFDTDSTLQVKSSVNTLQGFYRLDFKTMKIRINDLGGTKINELYDGKLFIECLTSSKNFAIKKDSLILYYNEKDYLIFNEIDYENR